MIFDLRWRAQTGWRRAAAFTQWAVGAVVFYGGGLLLAPAAALAAFFASPWPWWAIAAMVIPNVAAPFLIVLGAEAMINMRGFRRLAGAAAVIVGGIFTAVDIAALAPLWR